ncbi:hypothetical protein ACA910_012855 [Epithemia clementina (nom. ined.)]
MECAAAVRDKCPINIDSVFVGIPDVAGNFRDCIDSGVGTYHCSDDPIRARQIFDEGRVAGFGGLYNMGVVQRVDGTEAEQEAIEDVIFKMVDYFYSEVMSKSAYEGVRHNCVNYYELCAFWASVGECESNRQFMIPHCAAACRFCLLHQSERLTFRINTRDNVAHLFIP